MTDFACPSWAEALREFLLNMEATRAAKTHRYYKVQLGQLVRWADENKVPFPEFGKRDLDRFLVERSKTGKSQLTLHHDAICAKAFFAWCSRNDLLKRSPLADYPVRKAAKPAKYMPTDEDMRSLLAAVHGLRITMSESESDLSKPQPKPKRVFTEEFKREAVRLAIERGNIRAVARDLGLHETILSRRKYRIESEATTVTRSAHSPSRSGQSSR